MEFERSPHPKYKQQKTGTMKKLLLLALFLPMMVNAENISKSKITDVTVYQRGARVTNEAFINLKPGNNEVVISDITTSVNANSVQVKLAGSAILLSATTRVRVLENKELPIRTKTLSDSLQWVDQEITWNLQQKEVYNGEANLITANQKLGSNEEKATVEEIIRLSEFYRSRLLEIRKKTHSIDKKVVDLKLLKTSIQQKLQELQYLEKKSVGEIVLKVSSKTTTKVKATVTYLTYSAGWAPIYDVRAAGADKPVNLVYKANVYQTTGYNWGNTSLTISTGNPTANNNRPTMYPWYIDFSQPIVFNQIQQDKSKKMYMQNALQRATVASEAEAAPMLDEVATIGYVAELKTNNIAAEYKIDIPQEIPSDGKQHLVAIKEYELNSKFTYHSIPKLDKSAFLIAKVADYGNFNLLPGQSNLFFDGMYIGQSYLNPVTTVDSMLLSMGRDEKIIVKRNELKDLTARQSIGSNTKVTKAIEISVRNNNSYSIEMDLMDQIPLSKNKEIEVKIEDAGGAKIDVDYGSLLWKMNIKAGETQKVKFIYSVKYPKDKSVNKF